MDVLGEQAYNYVAKGDQWPTSVETRYHGTVVELPVHALYTALNITEPAIVAAFRHGMVFLFFLLGVTALTALAYRAYGDWRLALLAGAMLALTPRLFAHGFYNSRDIPNLALFSVAMWTLLRLGDRPTVLRAVTHASASALVLGLRMTGILLVPLTLAYLFLRFWSAEATARRGMIVGSALFLLFFPLCTIAVWPLLWENPLEHFIAAYRFMGIQPGGGLYLGKEILGIPWHYVPVWMFITVPLPYTFLFFTGALDLFVHFLQNPRRFFFSHSNDALFLAWCTGPIMALIVLNSGIYQEWRHVFFLYPGFLLIAVRGARMIMHATKGSRAAYVLPVVLGACMLHTAIWMYRNHPHENVYFSVPVSLVKDSFERDYWGLSYRQAIAYILENDSSPEISYYAPQNIAYVNGSILFPEERDRLFAVKDPQFAEYLVRTYRPGPVDPLFQNAPLIKSIFVDGVPVVSIYKGPFDAANVEIDSGN